MKSTNNAKAILKTSRMLETREEALRLKREGKSKNQIRKELRSIKMPYINDALNSIKW